MSTFEIMQCREFKFKTPQIEEKILKLKEL